MTAYAIAFAVRDMFFFGMFVVTLKRQEHYWDSFCLGICLVLGCNFIMYGMAQFSVVNVVVTAAVIALVISLNFLVRINRSKSRSKAREEIDADAKQYQKTWVTCRDSAGPIIMTNAELAKLWKDGSLNPDNPVEDSGTKMQIRQDYTDFEFLYFLAEFVNAPFNDIVSLWCSGKNLSGKADGKGFFDATNGSLFESQPAAIPGPIKSVQRSIEKVFFRAM